jgi:hypothetical protein
MEETARGEYDNPLSHMGDINNLSWLFELDVRFALFIFRKFMLRTL